MSKLYRNKLSYRLYRVDGHRAGSFHSGKWDSTTYKVEVIEGDKSRFQLIGNNFRLK